MVNRSTSENAKVATPKPYSRPTLVKGPILANVTALKTVSGISQEQGCWVARAAFGEADIRWMIFQAWLLDDAPPWFRRLYIRHGEAVGAWVAGRERARAAVRALMMPAVKRRLRR